MSSTLKLIFFLSFLACSFSDLCSDCGRLRKYSKYGPRSGELINDVKGRVANGEEALYAPWAVKIYVGKDIRTVCTGSLVDYSLILTAGHCFAGLSNQSLTPFEMAKFVEVWGGSLKLPEYTHMFPLEVKEVHFHKYFKGVPDADGYVYNDIALIILWNPPRILKKFAPICLGLEAIENYNVFIEGFGKLNCDHKNPEDDQYSTELRISRQVIQSNVDCKKQYGDVFNGRQLFCTKNGTGKGSQATCQGDAGGAVWRVGKINNEPRAVLVGLVSFGGIGGDEPDKPEINVRISTYFKWLLHKGVSRICF